MGILGNELVDWLAKAATKLKIDIAVNISKSCYKKIMKKRMVKSWNQGYLISNNGSSTKKFLPTINKKDCPAIIFILKGVFFERTATADSDVVQSGRPIFDDFFQHLWPYIGNNTANVVFQMVKRLWLIRIDQ
ncbi:hypothetical protein TNCV_3855441 [Trichonephila clavipes]|nr:hypothetical protein TNCV_3855441 [Trichonephila clavipes]